MRSAPAGRPRRSRTTAFRIVPPRLRATRAPVGGVDAGRAPCSCRATSRRSARNRTPITGQGAARRHRQALHRRDALAGRRVKPRHRRAADGSDAHRAVARVRKIVAGSDGDVLRFSWSEATTTARVRPAGRAGARREARRRRCRGRVEGRRRQEHAPVGEYERVGIHAGARVGDAGGEERLPAAHPRREHPHGQPPHVRRPTRASTYRPCRARP